MGFQPAHICLEAVDLEAGLLQHERDEVLHRALVAGHRWHPDEILRQLDAGVGIQRLESAGFCSVPDHRVSVMGYAVDGYRWGICCWPK